MGKTIRVLIAEDHKIVREGLRILIHSDPALEIAGETDNGRSAVDLARELRPDVVLMDLTMPRLNGIEATRCIGQQSPASRVLVLSACQDKETVRLVLESGASGYMTKHSAATELLTAIRQVGAGKKYISPKIAGGLSLRARPLARSGPGQLPKLTPREQQVLGLIAQGHGNKQVAYDLGVSVKTIEKHRQAVMDKLGIHDVAGLTRYALARGLTPAALPVNGGIRPLAPSDA